MMNDDEQSVYDKNFYRLKYINVVYRYVH